MDPTGTWSALVGELTMGERFPDHVLPKIPGLQIRAFCREAEGGDDSHLFHDLGLARTRTDRHLLIVSNRFPRPPT